MSRLVNPKIKLPNNVLYLDHEVAPSQPTTPAVSPPLEGSAVTSPPAAPIAAAPPAPSGTQGGAKTPIPSVHADAQDYYGGSHVQTRARTYSANGVQGHNIGRPREMDGEQISRNRRLSHDEITPTAPRRFLIDVEDTLRLVLMQEDTDNNFQISVYDSGPKLMALGTASSNAHKTFDIRGNYMMSNLLQELALARDYGRKKIILDEARLAENPVDRLSRMIKNSFWNSLTRRIDAEGLEVICADPKNRSRSKGAIIYIPHGEDEMAEHYREIGRAKPDLKLDVQVLPPVCDDPAFVMSLNDKPGILALAMEKRDGKLHALPFIVPGARFNEKYGWDSYFMALGLLVDGKMDMVKSIVEHCLFEIKHYNKVLNGNRSYYLARSQPPFLTDLALQYYNQLDDTQKVEHKPWLKRATQAAIKEYHMYWMVEPALDIKTGLSRYRPGGRGIPPETEASHFTHMLQPYADKLGISVNEYIDGYNDGSIPEPELDEYFLHDRGVRESGHDTSYRLEKKCADLATIDLNSLLYKYESDISSAIEEIFKEDLEMEDEFPLSPWPITQAVFEGPRELSTSRKQTAQEWRDRANKRKATLDDLCWNEGAGMFFDYDTKAEKQTRYESVTTMWPLWAGCASEYQADILVKQTMSKFEVAGGLVSGTEESRGIISLDRPNRQWDYPFAWPPHQILTWIGLDRYGYFEDSARLAYRWVYMMILSFVDFNGIVPEKFDAVELSHLVDAEYGNQGTDFHYVPKEGFGWTNAAFQIGVQAINMKARRAVAACTPPWVFFSVPPPEFSDNKKRRAEREAREAKAAETGHGGAPKRSIHHEPPSLEQAIRELKLSNDR